jgi:hypothetical protein
MNSNSRNLLAVAGIVTAYAFAPAYAYEAGYPGWQAKPGVLIGSSAGMPPPGIYMFNQVLTYDANLTGPGTSVIGRKNGVQASADAQGFLFVPGWTFLGATYDAVIAQPFLQASIGDPLAKTPGFGDQFSGLHNTIIIPGELSWKLGTSGFVTKVGLVVGVPDGTIQGPTGLANQGNPWWTFTPELFVSYLKDGWNLTTAFQYEMSTANSIDHYRTGDIFHADFTVTRTFGKWTLGPVGYYVAQVSNDSCPASCIAAGQSTAGSAQRFQIWGAGGLVEYNFGPASFSVWATQELSSKASNPAVVAANGAAADISLIPKGMTVLGTLSYRIWAPEEPTKPAMYHK